MVTKKTSNKKVQPLSMFTGRKQNHLRTGAKYTVMSLNRTGSNNKGAAASNAQMYQFNTKKDADTWAKTQSRRNESKAYVVVRADDRKLNDTYTHGKVNKSLTTELKKAYKEREGSKEYQSDLKLLK